MRKESSTKKFFNWYLQAIGILALIAADTLAPGSAAAWSTLPSRTQDTPGFQYTPSPADWRTKNIYQIITDRFSNGDLGNDNARGGFDPYNGNAVHGGDFKGIQNKLEYLQQLGVTAIWISPVLFNVNLDSNGNMPYHGYQPFDLNQIETHFGSLQDLRNLIDAAHARGIYVVLDVLVNNLADLISSKYGNNAVYNPDGYWDMWWWRGYTYPAPFDTLSRFHNNGAINDYNDSNQYIRGELTGGLDDVFTKDSDVRNDLATIYKALIAATDCDGFRVDAAKHVEMDFWDYFVPQIQSHAAALGKNNFLMFGEVFSSDDGFVGSFTGATRFKSMQYFPMRATAYNVFVAGQNTSQITERLGALTNYDPAARSQLISFLDNQDLPRLLNNTNLNDDWQRAKVALAFLYTAPAIPCLYYGTEQGFNGGTDPYNREDMFAGHFEFGPSAGDNFNTGHALFQWVQKLNQLRAACPALALGAFTQRWQNFSGAGIYAFSRQLGANEALVVLNTASTPQTCYPGVAHAAGTVFINTLNTSEVLTADVNQTLPVNIGGYSTKIFVPVADWSVQFVGNTYHWPPGSQLLPSTDFWINTDSWPQGAGANAFAVYSLDGTTWYGTNMTYAGPDVTNDWWHVNLGRFPAGTTIRYAMAVTDFSGATRWDNNHGSNFSATVSAPVVVMDGAADCSDYRQVSSGMTLYAAVRGTTLYVATVSPGTNWVNDHFIVVTDQVLPTASQPAFPSWQKAGNVAVDSSKPFLGGESQNTFVGWFTNQTSTGFPAAKWPVHDAGVMEGTIDLVKAFGQLPDTIYLCAVAYSTGNGGGLVAQTPAGNGDGNIDSNEFLAIPTVALKDDNGDCVCDRLDPAIGFAVTKVLPAPVGGFSVTWAAVPGKTYALTYSESPGGPWHEDLPNSVLTAQAGQSVLSYTDSTTPSVSRRFYRIRLVP